MCLSGRNNQKYPNSAKVPTTYTIRAQISRLNHDSLQLEANLLVITEENQALETNRFPKFEKSIKTQILSSKKQVKYLEQIEIQRPLLYPCNKQVPVYSLA